MRKILIQDGEYWSRPDDIKGWANWDVFGDRGKIRWYSFFYEKNPDT